VISEVLTAQSITGLQSGEMADCQSLVSKSAPGWDDMRPTTCILVMRFHEI
jgi:hypothetical protein